MKSGIAGRRLVRAIGYAIKADVKDEHIFHGALNKVGIEVKAKDLLVFHGGAKKGDWDIGIAMDAVRLAEKIDCLVLVSGDGDFKDLLTYLKQRGIRTEVLAFSKTASSQIKQEADLFVDLEKDTKKYLIGGLKLDKTRPVTDLSKNARPQSNKPYVKKPFVKKTFEKKPFVKKPFENKAFVKKPFENKAFVKKPFENKNFVKKPFVKREFTPQRPPQLGTLKQFGNKQEADMSDLFGDEAPEEPKKAAPKKVVKKTEPKTKKVEPKAEVKKVTPKKETKKTEAKTKKAVPKKETKKAEPKKTVKKESLFSKIGKKLKGE